MTEIGQYADGRTYELPTGWDPVSDEVLETALDATLRALDDSAVGRLATYYDPSGGYSGLLFAEEGENPPGTVTASDLWAVATLSIPVDSLQARQLFGGARSRVASYLSAIPHDAAITDLDHTPLGAAGTLERMWDLYATFKGLLSTETKQSNHWVFAAKLCARKRIRLFPVRDNLVCAYLGSVDALKRNDGRPGDFVIDIQVFAYLMTHPQVRSQLRELVRSPEHPVDGELLRLLDAVLWTKARWDR